MNSEKQVIVFYIALLFLFVLTSGNALSEDDLPEFTVPPPPFSEGIFPCSDCHEDMDVNPERRILEDEHTEISESFNHASEQRWCLDCHNPDNREDRKSVV